MGRSIENETLHHTGFTRVKIERPGNEILKILCYQPDGSTETFEFYKAGLRDEVELEVRMENVETMELWDCEVKGDHDDQNVLYNNRVIIKVPTGAFE